MADNDQNIIIRKETTENNEIFKPTFNASRLSSYCGNAAKKMSKSKLEFIKKYSPFKEFSAEFEKEVKSESLKSLKIQEDIKEMIKTEIYANIAKGSVSFENEEALKIGMLENKVQNLKDQNELPISIDPKEFVKRTLEKPETNLKRMLEKSDSCASNCSLNEKEPMEDQNESASYLERDQSGNQTLENLQIEAATNRIFALGKRINFYQTTTRGKLLEPTIMEGINKEYNMNFVKTEQTESKDFEKFYINGIVDGLDRNSETIIEIKTRKEYKGLVKDRNQTLVYLKLFKCKECWYVENIPSGEQRITKIQWDDKTEEEFEKNIVSKLEEFCDFIKNSLSKSEFFKLLKYFNDLK
jgi:hypothetical protein